MKNIFKGSCFKKGCGCLLVLVIILAIATYLLKPKWNDEYGERFTDVEYGQMPHNTYDLFLPVDAAKKDSLALILYVHGAVTRMNIMAIATHGCKKAMPQPR